MVDPTVISGVRSYMEFLQSEGLEISFSVIFGSQVNGKADKWSDIDLIIVSPQFDDAITREDINHLWRSAASTDDRIEPVPCGERQWEEDDSRAVIEIARLHGVQVTPAQ